MNIKWKWNWKTFTNNWGMKLISVLFSLMMWIIVTNINDPVIPYKVYNVPVKLVNTELITNQGQVYEVLDDSDMIDVVTVSAPRSVIDALNSENIVATADIRELTALDTVAIHLSTNKYNDKLESIRGNIDTVKLDIEEKQTITRALNAGISGTISEGYMVGDITTDQNLVRISGPESVVSTIDKAAVDVIVTGFTNNIVTDADIRLYDAEGNEVNRNKVNMNIDSVKVSVEILQIKSVPIWVAYMGEPAEGYRATGEVILSPQTIRVAGKANAINTCNQITIPEDAINITGQNSDMMTLIDIKQYLPTGIRLADTGFNGKVSATVVIEQEMEETFVVEAKDIAIRNVPEGYQVSLLDEEESYDVTVTGLSHDIQALGEQLNAYVDVQSWMQEEELETIATGRHRVTLQYELGNATVQTQETEVTIEVEEKE